MSESRESASRQSPLARALRPFVPQGARDAVRRRLHRLNEVPATVPAIDPATEGRLRAEFAAPNRELEDLLGRTLPRGWSVAGR